MRQCIAIFVCLLSVNLIILIVSTTDAIELTDYEVYDSLDDEETSSASVSESVRHDVTANTRRQIQSTRRPRRLQQVSSVQSLDSRTTTTTTTTATVVKHQQDSSHKFITRKRSVQPIGEGGGNSIGDQLFCMRTSRSNCASNEQPWSPGGMVTTQLRPTSVWHCLSTTHSPSCVCTCDGSCEPAIVKIKSTGQWSSRQQTASQGEMDRERPCDDCSCLSASIGSCFCSPGCG